MERLQPGVEISMFNFLFHPPWLGALTIFCLRITDMSLDTLRLLFVMRGRKALTGIF